MDNYIVTARRAYDGFSGVETACFIAVADDMEHAIRRVRAAYPDLHVEHVTEWEARLWPEQSMPVRIA